MLRLLVLISTFGLLAHADQPRSITVTGEAEILAAPETVELSVSVETLNADLRKAVAQNQVSVKKVIAAAEKLGVKTTQIQSDRLEVDPRSGSYESSRIAAFSVRRRIVLKTSDLPALEALMLDVLSAGANRVEAPQFQTESLRKFRDEARLLALKAAQEKASALAKATGAKLGRAMEIRETASEAPWAGAAMAQNSVRNLAPEPGAAGETMHLGKISVRAKIQATFELI